ncbi:MAG: SDR family NAD(P)-dependent oxidoreductase [Fusobacteriales bacterium]|jgi:NADP-dependent 3-hydroxy acid dehydrogenase YdfG|nr:SDR family NAD(P)-dependent oxidoreductase [Fusobacteriales bacterium]
MKARNVFITGASSGIGRAAAYKFAEYGDNLILCARRKENLNEIAQDIKNKWRSHVHIYELDVTNYEDVGSVVKDLEDKDIKIDILVNNAGLASGLDKFQDSSIEDIERMINTNLKGLIYVTRKVIEQMTGENSGHIINMGSTAGIYAYEKAAVYCASKAAVKTLSDGIRIDIIDKDIKITTIQPGIVQTDFSEVRFHGDSERAKGVYKGIEALQPEDIADVVLYVANQPKRVQITDVTIMANQQGTGFNIYRK